MRASALIPGLILLLSVSVSGPARADRCPDSPECKKEGRCTLVGNHCQATTQAQCRASTDCKMKGVCRLTRLDGGQRACLVGGTDADCRRTDGCRRGGACTAGPDGVGCQPRSVDDCRRSDGCLDDGRCALRRVYCDIGGEEDCRRSRGCKIRGRCRLVAGGSGESRCGASVEADCRSSLGCLLEGACTLDRAKCRVGQGDCKDTDLCRYRGACTARAGECVSDGDPPRDMGRRGSDTMEQAIAEVIALYREGRIGPERAARLFPTARVWMQGVRCKSSTGGLPDELVRRQKEALAMKLEGPILLARRRKQTQRQLPVGTPLDGCVTTRPLRSGAVHLYLYREGSSPDRAQPNDVKLMRLADGRWYVFKL